MQFSSDYEKIFYNYTLIKPKYLSAIRKGFYKEDAIDICSLIAKQFYEKYNETPTQDQMRMLIQNHKIASQKVTESQINLIYSIDLTQYDDEWLESTAESWIKWRNFDGSLLDLIEYVKTTNVTPENADGIINKAKNLINERNNLNFNSDIGLDFFNPDHHDQKTTEKIESGYNFIDSLLGGGYDKKSLIVYAGEQNIGKSIFLANDAVNFMKAGKNVAAISAEMSDSKLIKRIGANALNVPISEYSKFSKDKSALKNKLNSLDNGIMPPGKLFVKQFPTSQATVLDIESYLLAVEESRGIKLHVIVIDYINILANYRNLNTENTYMKIKQIAEDLRAMAIRNDWLIITATQINRDGYDSTEITMSNIAESAGLSHTADMMYAIIQDSTMYNSDPPFYFLKILKIRDGEGKNTKIKLLIDYNYMRLIEDEIITDTTRYKK